jgi:hypothetical protein
MVKAPVLRSRSIGTKVTEEEYARLEALAGGQSMSEWARGVLLGELERQRVRHAYEVMVSEVLAVRTVLLNALLRLANGQALDKASLQQLVERADGEKLAKARERLSITSPGTSSR